MRPEACPDGLRMLLHLPPSCRQVTTIGSRRASTPICGRGQDRAAAPPVAIAVAARRAALPSDQRFPVDRDEAPSPHILKHLERLFRSGVGHLHD